MFYHNCHMYQNDLVEEPLLDCEMSPMSHGELNFW